MKNNSAVSPGKSDGSQIRGATTEEERREFRRRLLEWFDDHQRDLPWRHVGDPYAVWVSEVMLQQTRVATVVDYFENWMERFPTVEALADTAVEEVLEMWSGLGYYRRARYLHQAARQIVDECGGEIPAEVDELQKLPGIGPYTAGAVASIAFGRREPLVDGNVMRVVARLFGIEGPPKRSPANNEIWQRAEELVDPDRPGDFNQGLMELGSEVCTTSGPRCGSCPVRPWCRGYATGDPEQFPGGRDRPEQRPMRARCCVVYRTDEAGNYQFLLRRRPEKGLLGGLWEFPGFECEGTEWPEKALLAGRIQEGIANEGRCPEVEPGESLGSLTHLFSHRRLKLRVHQWSLDEIDAAGAVDEGWRWVDDEDLSGVASAALLGKIEELWRRHRSS